MSTGAFDPIAIVGMAGRFPGAGSYAEFWQNISAGRESVEFRSEADLRAAGVPDSALSEPGYIRAVAEAPDLDMFDAGFFGLTPREARVADPQMRLFLEISHAAIEDAGYAPEHVSDVGVFASIGMNRYGQLANSLSDIELRSSSGLLIGTLSNPDYVATLVSYKLDLNGPSMTLLSACSSSMLAVSVAAQALTSGQCDMAIAGGADIEFPVGNGYFWSPGSAYSKDGHCRPFDADASGTVFGSGAGVVVLRRLDDALADDDNIRAVIRGMAVNNDGSDKIGFSAPSKPGQLAVIMEAMRVAGVDPAEIAMVEAHGTGTPLGDPVEVTALREAFERLSGSQDGAGRCALGSVKANVGHLGHAAGITSLIKTTLALENERIAQVVNFRRANPELRLDGSPFVVPESATPWPRTPGRPRLASVSSLGIGGTNVHTIVEEAPPRPSTTPELVPRVVVWSGKVPAAAEDYRTRLATYFETCDEADFADAVSTLQLGRYAHAVRSAVISSSAAETAAMLKDAGTAVHASRASRSTPAPVIFLLPGQGAQHIGMAHDLYAHDPAFASHLNQCLELFAAAGCDVAGAWRSAADDKELLATSVAQPLLFSVSYALARTLMSAGITPAALIGHSVGELAAAAVAQAFSLDDAVRLVAARAEAMAASPPGGMLAAAAAADEVEPLLAAGVGIAATNAPRQTVVSGSPGALAEFEARARAAGLAVRPIATSHAFHSELMTEAAAVFGRRAADIFSGGSSTAGAKIAVYSAYSGALMTAEQATDPAFWAAQLTSPVRFSRALDAAVAGQPECVLLECGPGRTLTALARQHPQVRSGACRAIPVLPAGTAAAAQQLRSVLDAAAVLWVEGHDLDWTVLYGGTAGRRTVVPGYPYQRSRYWIDPPAEQPEAAASDLSVTAGAGTVASADPSSPFSLLSWAEAPAVTAPPRAAATPALAFLPADGRLAADLSALLWRAGIDAIVVRPGDGFAVTGTGYQARPGSADDIGEVVRAVAASAGPDGYPRLLVHAWTLADPSRWDRLTLAERLDYGFHSLLALVQHGARFASGRLPDVLVLTERSADVSGAEHVDPARAMLHGMVRTLALEERRAASSLIDIGTAINSPVLTAEIMAADSPVVVAIRGNRRWIEVERAYAPSLSERSILREEGSYLITGGLGGLGLEVAKKLARTGLRPKLVLLGRRDPAPGTQAVVDNIAALGAEVQTVRCDLTDADALAGVIARTGPFHGVFHLAGVRGDGMLHVRDRAAAEATIAPKVFGTVALADALAGQQAPDLFACFGSRAAVDGLVGSGDYAAANAFMASLPDRGLPGTRTVCIDWPAWSEVGMAVPGLAAARSGHNGHAGQAQAEPAEGTRHWQTELSADSYAALDEHRIGSVPVMPGTGHIDLIVRAFRAEVAEADARPVCLRQVFFLRPLAVPRSREIQISFAPDGTDSWTFAVRATADDSADGAWTDHVTGQIGLISAEEPKVDLPSLEASLPDRKPRPRKDGLFTLGPRWDLRPQSSTSPADLTRSLITLTLPEAFASEAGEHDVHPALLDGATAHARRDDEPSHVPMMYREITVFGRLTPRLFSYIRRVPAADDLIVADVDLISPDGDVLARVSGYTMRRLPPDGLIVDVPAAGSGGSGGSSPTGDADGEAGIPPRVGADLLLRILDSWPPRPRVTVRPFRGGRPLPIEPAIADAGMTRANVGAPRSGAAGSGTATTAAPGGAVLTSVAPPVSAQASQPAPDGLVGQVARLWTQALGIEDIAATDNFFELGGNSLMAVDVTAQIRSTFGVDIGIAALFDLPTVADLAAELRRLGVADHG